MAGSHFKWKRLVKGDVIITDQSRQEHDSVCLSFWLWMLLKLFDCQYLFQYSKVAARLPKVSLLPPCATAANWEQAQCLCLPQSCPSDQQRLCQKVTRNQTLPVILHSHLWLPSGITFVPKLCRLTNELLRFYDELLFPLNPYILRSVEDAKIEPSAVTLSHRQVKMI